MSHCKYTDGSATCEGCEYNRCLREIRSILSSEKEDVSALHAYIQNIELIEQQNKISEQYTEISELKIEVKNLKIKLAIKEVEDGI